MAWTPQERRRFVQGLNEVERGVSVFYQYLIYGLLVGVTIFAFYLHRSFEKDAFHDFLDLFFGALYLIFLLWAFGTLFALRRRISSSRQPVGAIRPNPDFDMKFGRDPETGATGFSLRLGASLPPGSTPKTLNWGFALSSLADEDKPDESALARAAAYKAEGHSLEEISHWINPRYGGLSAEQRQVYRAYLQGMLEARGMATVREPVSASTAEPQTSSESANTRLPAPPDEEARGFIPGVRLTPGQVTLLVIVFGIFLAGIFAALWLSRAVK